MALGQLADDDERVSLRGLGIIPGLVRDHLPLGVEEIESLDLNEVRMPDFGDELEAPHLLAARCEVEVADDLERLLEPARGGRTPNLAETPAADQLFQLVPRHELHARPQWSLGRLH